MKKSSLYLSAAFLLAAHSVIPATLAQSPARPSAPAVSRPSAPAVGGRPSLSSSRSGSSSRSSSNSGSNRNSPRAVTQPDGKGALPIIPYDTSGENALNFQDASVDLVLMEYAMRTGLTLLKSPSVPAVNITLRTTPDINLSDAEYLAAIERALNLHGIALRVDDNRFLVALPFADLPRNSSETILPGDEAAEKPIDAHGQFVTKGIPLKYIDIAEAQTLVNALVRQGAQIQTSERTNTIIITDSADNINRIERIIRYIDIPIPQAEDIEIIQVNYAKAADIKTRLEEIVTQAQNEEEKDKKTAVAEAPQFGPPGFRRQLPPGVMGGNRERRNDSNNDAKSGPTTETINSAIDEASRGLIRGRVAIVADERTNVLFILSRQENMPFFRRMIEVLDKTTSPDYLVEVMRLEHAVAEDTATLLNDLIGKQKTSSNDADSSVRRSSSSGDGNKPSASTASRTATNRRTSSSANSGDRTRIGELNAENISILADERTNALIIMAPSADMASLRNIVQQMDIQLSQVVIETVIVSITFKDSLETGMDWIQRAMVDQAGKDGPSIAFATAGGGGTGRPAATAGLTSVDSIVSAGAGSGVTGWFTLYDLNLDLIIKAVKTDTRSRLMSAPRITTMDNKEAVLEATDRIYWKGDTTYYSNSDYTSENIKNEDIGIKLSVTPRINKKGYITLTVEQEIQTNEGYQTINGSQYPQLNTRKMGADVAVQSGETVVLGGLAQNSITKTTSKVPILGSIPLLGWFFRSETDEKTRTEIIVFLTPRVIDTPAQMEDDARKLKSSMETDGIWDPNWSNSRLADPISEREARRTLKRARETIAPARYPLTGTLTNLNSPEMLEQASPESAALLRSEQQKAAEEERPAFIHYSDLDAATRVQNATFYTEQYSSVGGAVSLQAQPNTATAAEKAEQPEETPAAEPEETPVPQTAPVAGDSEVSPEVNAQIDAILNAK